MKKIKSLLVLSLVLGLATIGATSAYADNENTSDVVFAEETAEESALDITDIEMLLSANEEQVKIDIQKAEEEEREAAEESKKAEAKKSEEKAVYSSVADKLEAIARGKVGLPYSYGSAGPYSFDCSGFTSYVYRQMGIYLPRTAADQAYGGKKVSRASLQKGDLVFFNTYGGISHVGIYIGGGNFIHASSYRGGVKVSNLGESYYASRYVTAARYF